MGQLISDLNGSEIFGRPPQGVRVFESFESIFSAAEEPIEDNQEGAVMNDAEHQEAEVAQPTHIERVERLNAMSSDELIEDAIDDLALADAAEQARNWVVARYRYARAAAVAGIATYRFLEETTPDE